MPIVRIPPPYRGPTKGAAEIEVAGDTVRACLDAAEARYPGFRAQVLTPAGETHRFVRLFLNGTALPSGALDRSVAPQDEIAILATIAGG
jgi:molybdopterin converting factor small subunit